MIDTLWRFPDRETAITLGTALGYCGLNKEGVLAPIAATLTFAVCEIGEHFTQTGVDGNGFPIFTGDGYYWSMIRGLGSSDIPAEAAPFLIWNSTDRDENNEPIPRPAGAPQNAWA